MSGLLSQLGVAKESTYGTAVPVTKFIEYNTETLAGHYERIDSEALRAGSRMLRSDRFAVNPKGASGDIEFEVISKGFAFWLEHMLGTVATGTAQETTVFTHTGTVGALSGKSFTAQVGRPQVGSSTVTPFTYEGGKVTAWELSNTVDGILKAKMSCDFEQETYTGATPYTLQTASYPTSAELLTFVGGTVQIAGTAADVHDISVSCDNGLKTDRYFIRSNSLKKEPLEAARKDGKVQMSMEFTSTAMLDRIAAATASGAVASVTATWQGPSIIGTTLKSQLQVTLPAVRFDAGPVNVNGPDLLDMKVDGVILDSGSGSPITVAYQTLDTTP